MLDRTFSPLLLHGSTQLADRVGWQTFVHKFGAGWRILHSVQWYHHSYTERNFHLPSVCMQKISCLRSNTIYGESYQNSSSTDNPSQWPSDWERVLMTYDSGSIRDKFLARCFSIQVASLNALVFQTRQHQSDGIRDFFLIDCLMFSSEVLIVSS